MKKILFFLLLISLIASVSYAKMEVTITGCKHEKELFDEYYSGDPSHPINIKNIPHKCLTRPLVDIAIIEAALIKSGIDCNYCFIACPNAARAIAEVKKGRAMLLCFDTWNYHFDDSVYKSSVVISKGEFSKGFYAPASSKLLDINYTLEELKDKRIIIEQNSLIDRRVLKKAGFTKIETAPKFKLLLKMLKKGRADFALLEFSNYKNLEIKSCEGKLYPIQNYKISIPYTRHFMVSKSHPKGLKIHKALEKGLIEMRNDGSLEKIINQTGMHNPIIKSWKNIAVH